MAIHKILSVEQMHKTMQFLRATHKIIVLAHGCFDWLHYGHLLHLREAQKLGDILIVSLTTDRFVNKGPGRPIFNQQQRAEMVAALECVDYVMFSDAPTAVPVINMIRPQIYAKGTDYRKESDQELLAEQEAVKSHDGALVFTMSPLWHTSELLRKYARS